VGWDANPSIAAQAQAVHIPPMKKAMLIAIATFLL
jgi:hypothetical protein